MAINHTPRGLGEGGVVHVKKKPVHSFRKETELCEVKKKLKDSLAEAESAQLRELLPLTREAVESVRSVLGTPEGLTRVLMRDDETEILSVLRAHNSKQACRRKRTTCTSQGVHD